MIKHFILGTALAALATVPALAGGYSAPVVDAAPMVVTSPAVIPAWAGGYVGANVNYGKGSVNWNDDLLGEPDGASGAIRAGYDWQVGQGVFGIGAEYNLGKYKDVGSVENGFEGEPLEMKNVATIFARAGYAFNESMLGYGILGYTRAKLEDVGDGFSGNINGVTVGLGAEYRLNENWSGYGEYAYTDFRNKSIEPDDTPYRKMDLSQIKLGVNYRF